VSEEAIEQVKINLHVAIQTAPDWSKAWHSWALFNAQMLEYYARTDQERAQSHVAPAVAGFFKSVALGQANQMPGGNRISMHWILWALMWMSLPETCRILLLLMQGPSTSNPKAGSMSSAWLMSQPHNVAEAQARTGRMQCPCI